MQTGLNAFDPGGKYQTGTTPAHPGIPTERRVIFALPGLFNVSQERFNGS
jgi:hypothetical protein